MANNTNIEEIKIPLTKRGISDYEARDTLKVLVIAKEPLEKDKERIYDSATGKTFMRTCDKSKIRLKGMHISHVKDSLSTNYSKDIFLNILFHYAYNAKTDLNKVKLVFVGQEAFDAFKEDYNTNTEYKINETNVYLNEEKKIIKVTSTFLPGTVVELAYTFISNEQSVLTDAGCIKLISDLDLLYADVDKIEQITNAQFIDINPFIEYLDKVKQLYLDKKIEYVAFDIETNTVEWAEPWSKICLISVADDYTKMAYSCAQYHPELWISDLRRTFITELLTKLYEIPNFTDNEQYVELSKEFTPKIKTFRATMLVEQHEVVSYFEDSFYDAALVFLKAIGGKLPKKQIDTGLQLKLNMYNEFIANNKETLEKIHYLLDHSNEQVDKMKRLWVKLDEVLSIVPIVGQNIKFDVGFVYSKNIARNKIKIVGDTLAEACMFSKALDEHGLKMELDLESLYERETGKTNAWKSAFKSSNRVKVKLLGTRYDNVELDKLGVYSALDAYCTLELHQVYLKKMEQRIKEDGCNKVQTFLMEQYKAISMFSAGEIMKWSPLSSITKILYDESLKDMDKRFNEILNLKMVQKFLADNPEEETFKINSAGYASHKAKILFGKQYFGFEPIMAGATGAPSTDTEKVLKVILSAIKNTLNNNLDTFGYRLADRTLKDEDRNWSVPVCDEYREMLKEAKIFIESLLNYSMWNKLNTAYISSVWDNEKQEALPYRANFKIVNATLSGRLSSGMHTQPKEGHIRDMYNSIWNSHSNRVTEIKHEIGETYNPDFGLVDIEYEDGTIERTTWKEIENTFKK